MSKNKKTFHDVENWITEEGYYYEYSRYGIIGSTEEDESYSSNYVESPGYLRGVRGSLSKEREHSKPKNFNKDLKLLKSIEKQSRFYLSTAILTSSS